MSMILIVKLFLISMTSAISMIYDRDRIKSIHIAGDVEFKNNAVN